MAPELRNAEVWSDAAEKDGTVQSYSIIIFIKSKAPKAETLKAWASSFVPRNCRCPYSFVTRQAKAGAERAERAETTLGKPPEDVTRRDKT